MKEDREGPLEDYSKANHQLKGLISLRTIQNSFLTRWWATLAVILFQVQVRNITEELSEKQAKQINSDQQRGL